jgi:hypothetical protein
VTYRPKTPDEMTDVLAVDGPHHDLVTRLAEIACGGQGPETDRVAGRICAALPDYVVALRDHELRIDRRTSRTKDNEDVD